MEGESKLVESFPERNNTASSNSYPFGNKADEEYLVNDDYLLPEIHRIEGLIKNIGEDLDFSTIMMTTSFVDSHFSEGKDGDDDDDDDGLNYELSHLPDTSITSSYFIEGKIRFVNVMLTPGSDKKAPFSPTVQFKSDNPSNPTKPSDPSDPLLSDPKLFTPMTIGEIMRLETPYSRLDAVLNELSKAYKYSFDQNSPFSYGNKTDEAAEAKHQEAHPPNVVYHFSPKIILWSPMKEAKEAKEEREDPPPDLITDWNPLFMEVGVQSITQSIPPPLPPPPEKAGHPVIQDAEPPSMVSPSEGILPSNHRMMDTESSLAEFCYEYFFSGATPQKDELSPLRPDPEEPVGMEAFFVDEFLNLELQRTPMGSADKEVHPSSTKGKTGGVPSSSTGQGQRRRTLLGRSQEFTVESLKRNWDREEDEGDEDETESLHHRSNNIPFSPDPLLPSIPATEGSRGEDEAKSGASVQSSTNKNTPSVDKQRRFSSPPRPPVAGTSSFRSPVVATASSASTSVSSSVLLTSSKFEVVDRFTDYPSIDDPTKYVITMTIAEPIPDVAQPTAAAPSRIRKSKRSFPFRNKASLDKHHRVDRIRHNSASSDSSSEEESSSSGEDSDETVTDSTSGSSRAPSHEAEEDRSDAVPEGPTSLLTTLLSEEPRSSVSTHPPMATELARKRLNDPSEIPLHLTEPLPIQAHRSTFPSSSLNEARFTTPPSKPSTTSSTNTTTATTSERRRMSRPVTGATATPRSKGSMEAEADARIQGDFSIWTMGSSKLHYLSIKRSYVGLQSTALSHDYDGQGHVLPAVASSIQTSTSHPLPPARSRGYLSSWLGLGNSHPTSSLLGSGGSLHGPGTGPMGSSSPGSGYYCVNLLECVIRPDVELKEIMKVVFQVAKEHHNHCDFVHRNHAILHHPPSSNLSNMNSLHHVIQHRQTGSRSDPLPVQDVSHPSQTNQTRPPVADHEDTSSDSSTNFSLSSWLQTVAPSSLMDHLTATNQTVQQQADREWDLIDVQVCISKELRQRVLVLQFLVSSSSSSQPYKGSMIGGLIMGQFTPDGVVASARTKWTRTKKLIHSFKKELAHRELSLSCLYRVSLKNVCALPQGLDTHFRAQLHSLCREMMWKRLEADFQHMDEHVALQEEECNAFSKTLEPIFRQYGIAMPPALSTDMLLSDLSVEIDPSPPVHPDRPLPLPSSSTPSTPLPSMAPQDETIETKHGRSGTLTPSEKDILQYLEPSPKPPPLSIQQQIESTPNDSTSVSTSILLIPLQSPTNHHPVPVYKEESPVQSPIRHVNKTSSDLPKKSDPILRGSDLIDNHHNRLARSISLRADQEKKLLRIPKEPIPSDPLDPVTASDDRNTSTSSKPMDGPPLSSSTLNQLVSSPSTTEPSSSTDPSNDPSHSVRSKAVSHLSLPLHHQHPPPPSSSSSSQYKSPVATKQSALDKHLLDISNLRRVDGMTFCLVMLDQCFEEIQTKCDFEYSARLQQKNLATVHQLERISEYRRSLLTFIAYHSSIEDSALMKTFRNLFQNVPVSLSPDAKNETVLNTTANPSAAVSELANTTVAGTREEGVRDHNTMGRRGENGVKGNTTAIGKGGKGKDALIGQTSKGRNPETVGILSGISSMLTSWGSSSSNSNSNSSSNNSRSLGNKPSTARNDDAKETIQLKTMEFDPRAMHSSSVGTLDDFEPVGEEQESMTIHAGKSKFKQVVRLKPPPSQKDIETRMKDLQKINEQKAFEELCSHTPSTSTISLMDTTKPDPEERPTSIIPLEEDGNASQMMSVDLNDVSSSSIAISPSAARRPQGDVSELFFTESGSPVRVDDQVDHQAVPSSPLYIFPSKTTSSPLLSQDDSSSSSYSLIHDYHDHIVLYYCACLVGNLPGTMYITPRSICLASGILMLQQQREIWPLSQLDEVYLPSKTTAAVPASSSNESKGNQANPSGTAFYSSNCMRLSFYCGKKEILISPMVVDCQRVRLVVLDIRNHFIKKF